MCDSSDLEIETWIPLKLIIDYFTKIGGSMLRGLSEFVDVEEGR
jgi:hypothetical protein